MAQYRPVPTITWVDDTLLSMSPEQKLIFLYLHTCPSSTQCGIYKLPLKTMGFHLGYTQSPVESALVGLCAAFPDFVAYDRTYGEVALLQYPKHILTNANNKVLNVAASELSEIQSIELLKAMIAQNSATINQMYLSRLRQIQMLKINAERFKNENELLDGDLLQDIENQQDAPKRKSKVNTKESKVKEREEPTPKKAIAKKEKIEFVIPEIEDVRAHFEFKLREEKIQNAVAWSHCETDKFFAHYEKVNWRTGKTKMSSWKTAIGGWVMRSVQNGIGRWVLPVKYQEFAEQKSNGYGNANRNTDNSERYTTGEKSPFNAGIGVVDPKYGF